MTVELPPRMETISVHDIDELAERMKAFGWNMLHRQIEGGAFAGELIVAQLAGMQFARMTYNRGIRSRGDSPAGTIAIAVPLSVPRSLHWHGYNLSPDHALLQKSSLGLDFLRRGDFPLALVSISIDSLLEAAELTGRTRVESLVLDDTRTIRPDAGAVDRFRFHFQNLFPAIRSPQTLPPELAAIIRADFLDLMLDLLESNQTSPPFRPSSRYSFIKRAEEMLLENLDRPLAVTDLCKEIHVSERTLRYGFRECFGMAPAAYLKAQRLNGVRRQLKAGDGATVSDVAIQWGFWHMGQFAKDYRKMFGESPSQTLRRGS
ncbi:helix-turn-helix domain-containing protein [Pannus brasiliensis CCIBt3594]|uniref:Helix-turn-helix domain-containing protein n=1 Tax=Pannus brasiliensis CCIBt3594 TaxID=1427578 RepID=A0AAW9QTV8_9CHRO